MGQDRSSFVRGVQGRVLVLGPLGLAVAAAVGVALVYALFVGTNAGRAVDDFLVDNLDEGGWERGADAVVGVFNFITVPVLGAVIVATALGSGGPATALRVVVLIVGASLTARGLEELLGTIDPLGAESERDLGSGFYPSGHAAVIASLCLAAVLAAPPRCRRQVAAGAAGAAAILLGWALPVGGSHHPSDVLGGALVALGWAAVCWRRGGSQTGPESRHFLRWPCVSGRMI